jgi:hypothetical protein
MMPSNKTVIRFIAIYSNGFYLPVKQVILVYGFKIEGGATLAELASRYNAHTQKDFLYAGYLFFNKGDIEVLSGGSESLGIVNNNTINKKFESEINTYPNLRSSVLELFPSIVTEKIRDVMIAL